MQWLIDQHPALFALGFAAYFIGLWFLVGIIISLIGGWWKLGKSYQTIRNFPENTFRMRSGNLRWIAGYNNALTLGSDIEGLYMGTPFLFRIGHPRLFIPWKDVVMEPIKKCFFWSTQTLIVGPSKIPLKIRSNLAIRLLSLRP